VRDLVACYLPSMISSDWLADLAPERVRPLKRAEYERLVEAGFFEDEPIELLDGVIYNKYEDELVRPLKRVEYEWLVNAGWFEDERIELLDGAIVEKSPHSVEHATAIMRLTRLLVAAVGERAWVRVQLSFAASDIGEPEPDLAVVPLGSTENAHPSSALLLVEVSAESLRKDRRIKASVYARSGVPEYWVVNVLARSVERFTAPVDGTYTRLDTFQAGDVLRPAGIAGVEIPVAAIFG
jgi:Uma2 family endonuclease